MEETMHATGKRELQEILREARGQLRKRVSEASARETAARLLACKAAATELGTQKLALSPDEAKGLAIRMQQELPRAWAFVYGVGNRSFLRLEDAVLQIVDSYAGCSRPTALRNEYFEKRNRDGLGPTKIAEEWNAKSKAEKCQIAPRAIGHVTSSAVKKALQRRKRARSGKKA